MISPRPRIAKPRALSRRNFATMCWGRVSVTTLKPKVPKEVTEHSNRHGPDLVDKPGWLLVCRFYSCTHLVLEIWLCSAARLQPTVSWNPADWHGSEIQQAEPQQWTLVWGVESTATLSLCQSTLPRFLGDLRRLGCCRELNFWATWTGRPKQITYRQRLPKVCVLQFHSKDKFPNIFWVFLNFFG